MSHFKGCITFLEIIFVGQCEVFVYLDFVHFFLSLGSEAHRFANGCQLLKKCKFFSSTTPLISSLCMLYKIFHNPSHPLHSELPNLFHPRRVTRGSLSINSLSFSPMRFHTSQYSRCFIPATTKLWNELPSMLVEATELQKFKIGANAFLLGVDGL